MAHSKDPDELLEEIRRECQHLSALNQIAYEKIKQLSVRVAQERAIVQRGHKRVEHEDLLSRHFFSLNEPPSNT